MRSFLPTPTSSSRLLLQRLRPRSTGQRIIHTQPFLSPETSLSFDPSSVRPRLPDSAQTRSILPPTPSRDPDTPKDTSRWRAVQIMDLPLDTTEDQIRAILESHDILATHVGQLTKPGKGDDEDRATGRWLVKLVSREDIPKLTTLFPQESITYHRPQKRRTPPNTTMLSDNTLFIKDLPPHFRFQDIESTFDRYGLPLKFGSIKLILTEDDGGVCACVKVRDAEEQRKALSTIEGMSIMRARGDFNHHLKSTIRIRSLADLPPGYGIP